MTASPIDLRLGRWQDVLADVSTCDSLICDPPYSARTHEGTEQDMLDRTTSPAKHRMKKEEPRAIGGWERSNGKTDGEMVRRSLNYTGWTADDVGDFIASWAPRTKGWIVCMTSHDLAPAYTEALEAAGRYVFAPLPFFSPGSRVRLSGDGPSSWTCWIVVSRPRHDPYAKWGTLPGGYVHPPGKCPVVGGKPLGLMQAIVRDYSLPGDLVVDPFCGSGTTALACAQEGRRCITSEEKPEHYEIARRRLARGYTPNMFT